MTRILFVAEAGDSACTEARALTPAQGLRLLGHDVDVCSVMFENVDGCLYGFDHVNQTQLPKPRIIVVRHTQGPEGEHWDSVAMYQKARKHGQRIFFDMDDDFWNLPDWNPATGWITPAVQELVVRNVNACDGLLAATPAIAESAQEHGVTVPVHGVRNGLDATQYVRRESEERSPLRLGWIGATNFRTPDLELCTEALRKVLDGRNDVEFWHLGWQPTKLSVRDILGHDFPVAITEYPWVPIEHFPRVLPLIDVAFIPQPVNAFSAARSAISGLRLCAAGIPFVATRTPEYERLFMQGGGYVIDNDNWLHGVAILVEPEYNETRRQLRNSGLAVTQLYTPERTTMRYEEVFEQ